MDMEREMNQAKASSVDWERDVYANGKRMNKWPYSEVVSSLLRACAGRDRRGISVLEVGCGTGNNLWFLSSEGFQASGIDRSPTAIAYARERLAEKHQEADLRVGDISSLPWADNAFDFVIDRGALTQNAYSQIESILNEALRVLKPGGMLMSFTLFGMGHPERAHGKEVAYHSFDNFREGYFRSVGLTSFFTREDLRLLFKRFGKAHIERIATYD